MLEKFRLREWRKCVQLLKINKSNRNESSLSDFLSSLFSPAMVNTLLAAGKHTSLVLDKTESLLESKILKVLYEKIYSLQETVSLLNKCIGKENQGHLETDKELRIFGKDFKNEKKK